MNSVRLNQAGLAFDVSVSGKRVKRLRIMLALYAVVFSAIGSLVIYSGVDNRWFAGPGCYVFAAVLAFGALKGRFPWRAAVAQ